MCELEFEREREGDLVNLMGDKVLRPACASHTDGDATYLFHI